MVSSLLILLSRHTTEALPVQPNTTTLRSPAASCISLFSSLQWPNSQKVIFHRFEVFLFISFFQLLHHPDCSFQLLFMDTPDCRNSFNHSVAQEFYITLKNFYPLHGDNEYGSKRLVRTTKSNIFTQIYSTPAITIKSPAHCVGLSCAKTALSHQGMDLTRPLMVCCGGWHYGFSSRSFKSNVWHSGI